MSSIIVYVITLLALTYAFKQHKGGCKVAVMEMNYDKFNVLAVTFLFAILELACIICLVIDFIIDDYHSLEISLFVLNTVILLYYLTKHKSNLRYYYSQLKKIGKNK